jgi:hypothetical protein
MKKLITCLKVYAFAVATLGKKVFKKESKRPGYEAILFV